MNSRKSTDTSSSAAPQLGKIAAECAAFGPIKNVEDRIREAARTLRLLPSMDRRFLAQLRSWWPEAPDEWSAYAATDATAPRIIPSAAEIDRLDQVLTWMTALAVERLPLKLPEDTGRIVWARAAGASWPRIMRSRRARQRGGNSRESLRQVYRAGLAIVAARAGDGAMRALT